MALQLFVGPWPLIQFRNHFYTDGRTPWTSDQPVARPLPTHRTQTHNKSTHRYPCLEWDPSVRASEDSSCLRSRGHRDRHRVFIICDIIVELFILYVFNIIQNLKISEAEV
jgi:hypothetical protein